MLIPFGDGKLIHRNGLKFYLNFRDLISSKKKKKKKRKKKRTSAYFSFFGFYSH